jgi:hypothetical protein
MQGHRKGREIVDRFVAPDGAERGPNWQPRDTVLLPRTAVQTGLVKKRQRSCQARDGGANASGSMN